MNNERRKSIKQCVLKLEEAKDILSDVCDDETDSRDNLNEGSLRYDELDENVDVLDDAMSQIEEVIANIENL